MNTTVLKISLLDFMYFEGVFLATNSIKLSEVKCRTKYTFKE